jgi:cell division protease FtsH
MEESVEVIIAGYQKKNRVMSDKEKMVVAYHEIGHALVAARQSESAPVHKITIIPRTSGALGYTMQVDEKEHFLLTKEELQNKIATLTGGRAAEALIFGQITTGASNDIERATAKARDMVARYGMSERLGAVSYSSGEEIFVGRDYEKTKAYSERTAGDIDAEVKTIMDEAYAKCTQILTEHGDKLDAVAAFLLDNEHMSRTQFLACMEGREIPVGSNDGLLDSFK